MEWFVGGVLNAIKTCRQKKALFIVYITDDSDASQATSQVWDQEEVVEVLKENTYVALKVPKNSTEFNQFSQFFAVFVFPSIYCIDLSGKPLIVLNGKQNKEVLKLKLKEAFLKLSEPIVPQASPAANSSEPPSQSSGATGPSEPSSSVKETPAEASASAKESPEDKLKRYEEKIRDKRAEKVAAERQREITKEKERRALGKDLAKLKDFQEDQRNKNWMTERQKQREEARRAREEVKAKLEQDRREREEDQRARSSLRQRTQEAPKSVAKPQSITGMARIQLRLPMGSTKIVEVNCSDALSVLRQKISEVIDTGPEDISLIRLYPRMELTTDMDAQSLQELNLVPTGVVIVRIEKKSFNSGGSNLLWTALMSMLNFIVWIFSIVKKTFVNLFQPSTTTESSDTHPSDREDSNRGVHRFRNDDDNDDDMGTYNGNSTQQQ